MNTPLIHFTFAKGDRVRVTTTVHWTDDANIERITPAPSAGTADSSALFGVWDQYFCAALLAQMSSQTLHDEPHLWQPYQAQLSASMADIMMAERAKRFPPNAGDQATASTRL